MCWRKAAGPLLITVVGITLGCTPKTNKDIDSDLIQMKYIAYFGPVHVTHVIGSAFTVNGLNLSPIVIDIALREDAINASDIFIGLPSPFAKPKLFKEFPQ